MKYSTSQETARQQAKFQLFLGESKEQIIQPARTPMFASTHLRHDGSGMMRSGQYSIPSESDFPTNPRPHAASGWTPTAQQSSLSNQPSNRQGRGTVEKRIEETLRVIEARDVQRPSLYGPSSRVSFRTIEQGPLQRGPQTKLPTYEGQEDIGCLFGSI